MEKFGTEALKGAAAEAAREQEPLLQALRRHVEHATRHLTKPEQRAMDGSVRRTFRFDPDTDVGYLRSQIKRLEWFREALSRAECRRQGIDPDDIIADGGHLAWHLVGYEAACKEIPEKNER